MRDEENTLMKIRGILQEGIRLRESLLEDFFLKCLADVAVVAARALKRGNKLLIFGNGGSAADAQHMAAELVGRFFRPRVPLAAIALTTDSSVLTSISNDQDFKEVFARQIRALGKQGDVAVAITTSGRSQNVLRGLQEARQMGIVTVGLTGGEGGEVAALVDYLINVPHDSTPRVQEMHITIAHILCELIEDQIVGSEGAEAVGPS